MIVLEIIFGLLIGLPICILFVCISVGATLFFAGSLWLFVFEILGFDKAAEWIYKRIGGRRL